MNQIAGNDEFNGVKTFETLARKEIDKIIFIENLWSIVRTLLLPLLLILSVAAFIPILKLFPISDSVYSIFSTTIMVVGYTIALYVFVKKIRNIAPFKYEFAETLFEKHYNLTAISPLSIIGSRPLNGDKNLWLYEIERIGQIKIKPRIYFPRLLAADKLLITALSLAFMIVGIDYKHSLPVLKPDFAVYFGGAPKSINAWVVVKDNQGAIIPLEAKNNQIKDGSEVEIEVNGVKFSPKITFDGNEKKLEKVTDGKFQTNIIINNSGTLKLKYFGIRKKWQIEIIKPPIPHFKGKIDFNPVGTNSIAAHFTINDKKAVDRAQLVLKGKINGNEIISTHEINIKDINSGENNIIIPTAESPLVGYDARAWIEIANSDNKTARSQIKLINVPLPVFSNDFSRAIAEIRLMILRETHPYKSPLFNFANINGDNIDVSDYIGAAPKDIKKAYALLDGINNAKNLELPILYQNGISYTLATLEGARNINEAHKATGILWEILQQSISDSQDTKSKVSDAIQKLKRAIQNGASQEELSQLRQELNNAIAQHIAELSQQNGDSGDMEVEDKTNLSGSNLQKMMDDIEENAKNGNSDDALSQLDQLDELMQNLSVSKQGGGEGNTSPSDLVNQQRNLMDETNSALSSNNKNPKSSEELAQKQKALEQSLETLKHGSNDDALSAAQQNMQNAEQALKNGDLQGALKEQAQALQNLKQSADQNQDNSDNKDPLGRAADQSNNGKSANGKGEKTKIPPNQDKNRVRDIIKTLREKLSNPDSDSDERDYYENLLKKK